MIQTAKTMHLLVGLSLLVAGLFLSAGCSQQSGSPTQAAEPAKGSSVPTVAVVKPERHTLRHTISQPGSIQAMDQPAIFSKIPGFGSSVRSRVTAGLYPFGVSIPKSTIIRTRPSGAWLRSYTHLRVS